MEIRVADLSVSLVSKLKSHTIVMRLTDANTKKDYFVIFHYKHIRFPLYDAVKRCNVCSIYDMI